MLTASSNFQWVLTFTMRDWRIFVFLKYFLTELKPAGHTEWLWTQHMGSLTKLPLSYQNSISQHWSTNKIKEMLINFSSTSITNLHKIILLEVFFANFARILLSGLSPWFLLFLTTFKFWIFTLLFNSSTFFKYTALLRLDKIEALLLFYWSIIQVF